MTFPISRNLIPTCVDNAPWTTGTAAFQRFRTASPMSPDAPHRHDTGSLPKALKSRPCGSLSAQVGIRFEIEGEDGAAPASRQLVEALAEWVYGAGARHIKTNDAGLIFKGGLFSYLTDWCASTNHRMALGWNLLIPITSAKNEIFQERQGTRNSCSFRFTELLIVTIALIYLFVGLEEPAGQTIAGLQAKVWLSVGWLGVFVFGYFISTIRVAKALATAAREALANARE